MIKHIIIAAIACALTLSAASAMPLSGAFTGIITAENISNLVDNTGSSVSGTFFLDPTGCTLGSNQSQNGGYSDISGCLTRNGFGFVLNDVGTTRNYIFPPSAPIPGGIISLSPDGGALIGEITTSPKSSATLTLAGAAGAFGTGGDYTSLLPGTVTTGSLFLRGTLFFESLALNSVTFDQTIGQGTSSVPEPSSMMVLVGGLLGFAAWQRLRPRQPE